MRRPRRGVCRYGSLGLIGCLVAIAVPTAAAAETCNISAVPPGPVQPGAYADVSANCTDGPTLIAWSSSLASCVPATGPTTVCSFPTVGGAVLTVQASYAGSFGGSFAGDSYPMTVSNAAPPSCYITAVPPGPVQPGGYADVYANCTDGPTLIEWSSSLANCLPATGPTTVCNFPTVGSAVLTVQASYGGSFAGCFAGDSYPMTVSNAAPPSCYITAVPPGPVVQGTDVDVNANCTDGPTLIEWSSSLAACLPATGPTTVCNFPTVGDALVAVQATYGGSFAGCFAADAYPMSVFAAPPSLASVASQMVHGNAGPFDLPLSAKPESPTTEPRSAGARGYHLIVFTFDRPVIRGIAEITEGKANVGSPIFDGNTMSVPLTDVADGQYVTISLTNVASLDGGTGGNASVRVGFLAGDASQNRAVTLSDLVTVNAALAQVLGPNNYLLDVNVSGSLSISDLVFVNSRLTKVLPNPNPVP